MPTNNENQEGTTWPMPKFRFEVDFGNELTGVAFQEVTGMDVDNHSIEYRSNNSPLFSTIKMLGIKKIGHITLKRGVFVADDTFWNWHHEITMNTIQRKTVVIKLLDESNKISMQWRHGRNSQYHLVSHMAGCAYPADRFLCRGNAVCIGSHAL